MNVQFSSTVVLICLLYMADGMTNQHSETLKRKAFSSMSLFLVLKNPFPHFDHKTCIFIWPQISICGHHYTVRYEWRLSRYLDSISSVNVPFCVHGTL